MGLDMNTGKIVAIKTIQLDPNSANTKAEIRAIRNEINTLQDLDHVNIIKYLYTGIAEDGNGVDIILEFASGRSLKYILDKF